MPDRSKTQEAEKKIQAALAEARELLGAATPRLINEKPQVESHAIRHGLTGQSAFLPVIQLRDYLIIGAEFIEEMRPIGVGEMQLAQQIIDTNWRSKPPDALLTPHYNPAATSIDPFHPTDSTRMPERFS